MKYQSNALAPRVSAPFIIRPYRYEHTLVHISLTLTLMFLSHITPDTLFQ